MKRDMDYVRDLLLEIEDKNDPDSYDLFENDLEKSEPGKLNGHLRILIEAAFLWGEEEDIIGRNGWYNLRLTWMGCEYLDNIRDPDIWKKTKESAQKVGGFSLEIMGDLAKGFIKQQIKKQTGVDLEI